MKYFIEFRNGGLFTNLKADNGTSDKSKAKQFNSISEANRLMNKHQWILANGGMVIPVEEKSSKA